MVAKQKTPHTDPKASLSAFLPRDLLRRLDERAEARFTSRSALVREAVHQYLEATR